MSDIVLHTAAKLESTKDAMTDRLANAVTRLREEDGQDMIEYAGVLVVVAVLIAGVVALLNAGIIKSLGTDITNMIDDIFGGKSPVSS